MRCRKRSAAIQEDLDDLVVVPMGRQDEGRDIRRESGRVRWQRLPALKFDRRWFRLVIIMWNEDERLGESGIQLNGTDVRVSFAVDRLFVVEQHFHGLDVLLGNGVE